jgi:hypothetical protein
MTVQRKEQNEAVGDGTGERLSVEVRAATTALLDRLDRLLDGCNDPGFAGWENGHGERVGDDVDDAIARLRAALAVSIVRTPIRDPDEKADFDQWREQQWGRGKDPTPRDAWMERAHREKQFLEAGAMPAAKRANEEGDF